MRSAANATTTTARRKPTIIATQTTIRRALRRASHFGVGNRPTSGWRSDHRIHAQSQRLVMEKCGRSFIAI